MSAISETAKYRDLTTPYCTGNGIDIGSGGDPVVPWAINMDLPSADFLYYHSDNPPTQYIQFGGDCLNLPFKDETLDFVYSSHLLEDFADWMPALQEWSRVLKVGGRMIVLIPDKALWEAALRCGQPPNCAHRHEGRVGELTEHIRNVRGPWNVVLDGLTAKFPGDYSILFVAMKLA